MYIHCPVCNRKLAEQIGNRYIIRVVTARHRTRRYIVRDIDVAECECQQRGIWEPQEEPVSIETG